MTPPPSSLSSHRRIVVVGAVAGGVVWLGIGCFVGWAETDFVGRWSNPRQHQLDEFSVVLSAVVVLIWIATSRGLVSRAMSSFGATTGAGSTRPQRWHLRRAATDDRTADVESPTEGGGALRSIERAAMPSWIDAMNRLLMAELATDPSLDRPKISVVRVSSSGIELLLEEEAPSPPPSFQVTGNGRIWQLDPSLDLAEIVARADSTTPSYLPALLPVGEDEQASYLVGVGPGESLGVAGSEATTALKTMVANLVNAPWAEVALYRLGATDFDGASAIAPIDLEALDALAGSNADDPLSRSTNPVAQPVVITQDRDLAAVAHTRGPDVALIGTMADANRVLYFADGDVTIEPIGLTVRATVASDTDLTAAGLTLGHYSGTEALTGDRSGVLSGALYELPPPGHFEVRILREHPDIVGDVLSTPAGNAVQFVAYLVTHGGSATTSRLRDALGAYRLDESKADKTVWSAASAARQALGSERIPNASGIQRYEIAGDVTCDWIRFQQMLKVARAAQLAGDTDRVISTLTAALELVEGVPGADERRFAWIDDDGIIHEIERQVVEAASSLVTLALANNTPVLAAWALQQGKLVSPEAEELLRHEATLAGRQRESSLDEGKSRTRTGAGNVDEPNGLDESTEAAIARFAVQGGETLLGRQSPE